MKATIIKIGNSKGLRLSKTILEKYNIKDEVELILQEEQIILKPIAVPRKDWGIAFEEMHRSQDDKLLVNDIFEDENLEEWN